ncbi:serine/threonine-protein kinase [Brytella acorum]|uniref:Protein kinase domain-containing protein n=1 Tax=Brytella acorum TaxID=2959299 RepID=A0AA35UWW0_9PROT|nr:hypothetical protein [Brytella acorum]MDF3624614.1 hypothetical protein [Brytella acorum]CAI9120970.1 hypothetical protein LMG32879_001812 [Brytella acorum]
MSGTDNLSGQHNDASAELRINGRFQVLRETSLPPIGGAAAFVATDPLAPGMGYAALAPDDVSARLEQYEAFRHPALMPVLAHDRLEGAPWILTLRPSGPSLASLSGPWRESQIVNSVIRPVASILMQAQQLGLTLRNLRPDNLYPGVIAQEVLVGPLGITPPAFLQPLVFESLSSAVCSPAARGYGSIVDDVFSLGVVILTLCLGKAPLEGLSDEDILRRRFELGTPQAYLRDQPVPAGLVSLLQAMLSDDPSQRPAPVDLVNMETSKLFSVRREKFTRQALPVGPYMVRSRRALAWAATRRPEEFVDLLRCRQVDAWLKKDLHESALSEDIAAAGIELVRTGGVDTDGGALRRIVHTLDADAPLYGGGQWFWPEALPTMLALEAAGRNPAASKGSCMAIATQVLASETDYVSWAGLLGSQLRQLGQEARRTGQKGAARIRRLIYDGNIWQRCLSPLCLSRRLVVASEALKALDASMAGRDVPAATAVRSGLIDEQMRAFLESHAVRMGFHPRSALTTGEMPLWLQDFALLAWLQHRSADSPPLPGLAAVTFPLLNGELKIWQARSERERRATELRKASEGGILHEMLDLVVNTIALRQDRIAGQTAQHEFEAIESQLLHQKTFMPNVDADTRRLAAFVTMSSGIGLSIVSCVYEMLH